MKLLFRTVFFHIFCIIIFATIYAYLVDDFNSDHKGITRVIDFLSLSATIQCGVGMSDLYPITFYSKLVIIIQQIIMLFTNVITLYIFTL
jgi:hypothetical protein